MLAWKMQRVDDLNKEVFDMCEGRLNDILELRKFNLGQYYSYQYCYLLTQAEKSYIYNQ